MDFLTDQNHSSFYETVLEQRHREVGPVVNAEYGYEYGPGGPEDRTYGVVQSPEELLCRACEIILAGEHPVHYYTKWLHRRVISAESPGSGAIREIGAGGSYCQPRILIDSCVRRRPGTYPTPGRLIPVITWGPAASAVDLTILPATEQVRTHLVGGMV